MKKKLIIAYAWSNPEQPGQPVPAHHREALEETALDQIPSAMATGARAGTLADNIHMDGDPEAGVPYTGTWEVRETEAPAFTDTELFAITAQLGAGGYGSFLTSLGEALRRGDLANRRKLAQPFAAELRGVLGDWQVRNPQALAQ